MKNLSLVTLYVFLGALGLSSCVQNLPTSKIGGEVASCASYQKFNKVTRKCEGVKILPTIPKILLSTITMTEDVNSTIIIDYSDNQGDLATSCTVASTNSNHFSNPALPNINCSCSGGICLFTLNPRTNINNDWLGRGIGPTGPADVTVTVTDKDGTSIPKMVRVDILPVNDTPSINLTPAFPPTAATNISLIENQVISSYNNDTLGTINLLSGDTANLTDDNALYLLNPIKRSKIVIHDIANGKYYSNFTSAPGVSVQVINGPFITPENVTVEVIDNGRDLKITAPSSFGTNTSSTIYLAVQDEDTTSSDITIPITINLKPTVGENLVTTIKPFTPTTISFPYDNKNLNGTSCSITSLTSISATTASQYNAIYDTCACAAGVCKINGLTTFDKDGTLNVNYTLNGTPATNGILSLSIGALPTTNINILKPVTSMQPGSVVLESTTAGLKTSGSFSLPFTSSFFRTGSIFRYELVTPPAGTLSGCVSGNSAGSTFTPGATCIYEATGDNNNGAGAKASLIIGTGDTIKIESLSSGTWSNGIQVQLIPTTLLNSAKPVVFVEYQGPNPTDFPILKIYFQNTTTLNDIITAINTNLDSSLIVNATLSAGTGAAAFADANVIARPLVGGINGADSFTYKAIDVTNGRESQATISIDITPQADDPVICNYGTFLQAPQCGILGCIGNDAPSVTLVGKTIPPGTFYYDQNSTSGGTCYFLDAGSSWIPQDPAVHGMIPNQTVNEGDILVISNLIVDEGGNDTSENTGVMSITDVQTSDSLTIPKSAIKFKWGATLQGKADALPYFFGDVGTVSSDTNKLNLEISPVVGHFGNVTIDITFTDSAGPVTKVVSFDVNVQQSSVIHNGWANIKSIGPKVLMDGITEVVLENNCITSKNLCSGLECIGTNTPEGNIIADEKFAIYQDTTTGLCYINNSDGVTDTFPSNVNWLPLRNSCFQDDASMDANKTILCTSTDAPTRCAGVSAPIANSTSFGLSYAQYVISGSNVTTTCWKNAGVGVGAARWKKYSAPGEVTLEWKPFSSVGMGTIEGYNIYRVVAGQPMDYTFPINKMTIPASFSNISYVDNYINSISPPLPETVYQYEVKAKINGVFSGSNFSFSKIKVLVPPNNKAFVKRRIVNKVVCNKMHINSTSANKPDKINSNRCKYYGPGDTDISGTSYYDIGAKTLPADDIDYIVDRFEAGCPYTNDASSCILFTADGNCIGTETGTSLLGKNATLNSIYYSRTEGKCYIESGAGTWTLLDETLTTTNNLPKVSYAHLPPLTNITKVAATNICQSTEQNIITTNFVGYNSTVALPGKLPSKKEQLAFFHYADNLSDSSIISLESGGGLSNIPSASKCNTSSANGLEADFLDFETPPSSVFYTLPGTASSGIRSLMTGSDITANCQSRFGVQDHVGNVAEFTNDTIDCTTAPCKGVGTGDYIPDTTTITDSYPGFQLDGDFGPCVDVAGDGSCDNILDQWTISTQLYDSIRFSLPMGLPVHTKLSLFSYPSSNVANYVLDIGPSNGILSTALHDDMYKFNLPYIFTSDFKIGNIVGGGSYLDGLGAGIYYLGLKPSAKSAASYEGNGFLIKDLVTTVPSNVEFKILSICPDTGANPSPGTTFVCKNSPLRVDTNIAKDPIIYLATDSLGNPISTGADIVSAITGGMIEGTCTGKENGTTEVQTITFGATPDSGTFDITYAGFTASVDTGGGLLQVNLNSALATIKTNSLANGISYLADVNLAAICSGTSCSITFNSGTGTNANFDHQQISISNNTVKDSNPTSISVIASTAIADQGVLPHPCHADGIYAYALDANVNLPVAPTASPLQFKDVFKDTSVDTGFRCVYEVKQSNYK